MTRLDCFKNFQFHPMLAKDYKRLSKEEHSQCLVFIINNDDLDKSEFAAKVNRWFLDNPNKPRRWTLMCDLVMQANGGAYDGQQ